MADNENKDDSKLYFGSKSTKGCVEVLEDKISSWENSLTTTGLVDKIHRSRAFYHGDFDGDQFNGDSHKVKPTGDQGELMRFPVNHYRNIGMHMSNMTTANRPAMSARSLNTDYKSLTQTTLANGLLDYYMREKNLEDVIKQAVEYAIVLSEGWVKAEWDATAGDTYGFNEETKTYIYNGDIRYRALTPIDVIRDCYKSDSDQHDWLIVKTYKNKYDLIAKFPEYEKEILNIQTKDTDQLFKFGSTNTAQETDDIAIYEFFHNRTDACPDGRYIMFINSKAIPIDVPLPYRMIPVFPIMPSRTIGTPFGYTIMFDLLPIQEAINMLNSIIITNQNAFGVQNVMIPRGADVNITELAGGLNLIEYNSGVGAPAALNLTSTPKEIFDMLNKLEATMETISGINQVTRGDPSSNLRSGSALALIQAQAVQFASGLQQSYVRLVESIGTSTIKILQDFAQAPRVAAIVGKSNKTYLKEFTGQDLSNINRVIVDVSNPVSRTTAGKLQIATDLLQYQMVDNPEQYFNVLNNGQLDTMTQGQQHELLLIQNENERLSEGEEVPVLAIDSHAEHIKEHKSILYDTELRKDPMLVQSTLNHIQQHIEMLKNVDPNLLNLIGEQSLQPPPMQPGAPGQPPAPNQAEAEGMDQTAQNLAPPPTGVEEAQALAQPSLPTPPGEFSEQPITPQEQMATYTGQ